MFLKNHGDFCETGLPCTGYQSQGFGTWRIRNPITMPGTEIQTLLPTASWYQSCQEEYDAVKHWME